MQKDASPIRKRSNCCSADLGWKHIQFNVVGKDTLYAAQKQPEQYRDLVVRVAGYSAYFVKLTRSMQDEIIGRMEFQKTV